MSPGNRPYIYPKLSCMHCKIYSVLFALIFFIAAIKSQKTPRYVLNSPDQKIRVDVDFADGLHWAVAHGEDHVIDYSGISIQLQGGEVIGKNIRAVSKKTQTVNQVINTVLIKRKRSVITIMSLPSLSKTEMA